MSFLWIFFFGGGGGGGVMPFLNYFLGSSIILSNFLGFAHFLGNLFISIKIEWLTLCRKIAFVGK